MMKNVSYYLDKHAEQYLPPLFDTVSLVHSERAAGSHLWLSFFFMYWMGV